jgi:hypothetical protein
MKKLLVSMLLSAAVLLVSGNKVQASGQVWANSGNKTGTVDLGWAHRGGSCHVRYTEANQTVYKYQTVANCNQAQMTISHLVPGVKYKFQVSQDNHHWSYAVMAVAASTSQPQAVANAPHHYDEPAEDLPAPEFQAQEYRPCSQQGTMQTQGALNHDERKTGKCGTGVCNMRTVEGPRAGEVTVYWTPSTVSDGQYHLVYGTESGHYTMGALNVGGESNSYTVKGLSSGQRYYFKLVPVNNGQPVGSSWEVSDVAP